MMGEDFGLMADLALLNDPNFLDEYRLKTPDNESEAGPEGVVVEISVNETLPANLAPTQKANPTVVPQEQSQKGVQEMNTNEIMNGALAPETNAPPYIVLQGHSEQGVAGLIGLTLEQVQSGMRNKRAVETPKVAGVRNTVTEKPKPAAARSLYQNAGVKKSAKVAASPINIQVEGEKRRPVRSASIAGLQTIGKPSIATETGMKLPPFITAEKLEEIKKMANVVAFDFYVEAVKAGIVKAQKEFLAQQGAYQQNIQPSAQHALYPSPIHIMELNPHNIQQTATYHTQQPHSEQVIDHAALIDGNPTIANIAQQQICSRTPRQPLMTGFQAKSYTTPPGAYETPLYSVAQGNQEPFYQPSLVTPPSVGPAMSYGPSTNASQVAAYQAPNDPQMPGVNFQPQTPRMLAYPDMLQDWQFAQSGQQLQQQVSRPTMQQPLQQLGYYAPTPEKQQKSYLPQYDGQNQAQLVAQQNGYLPQHNPRNQAQLVAQQNSYLPQQDPLNQAQLVAQQHRIQQNEMQLQHLLQSGMQYHPTMQDNIACSVKMMAQANAGGQQPNFDLSDFFDMDEI